MRNVAREKKAEIMDTQSYQESRSCTRQRSSIHIASALPPPTFCSLISRDTLVSRGIEVTKTPFPSQNTNLSQSKLALQDHNECE